MWQVRGQALLTHLGPNCGMGERKRAEKKEKEKRVLERDPTFSLNFPTIGPAVSGGARGRVHPHSKGFV